MHKENAFDQLAQEIESLLSEVEVVVQPSSKIEAGSLVVVFLNEDEGIKKVVDESFVEEENFLSKAEVFSPNDVLELLLWLIIKKKQSYDSINRVVITFNDQDWNQRLLPKLLEEKFSSLARRYKKPEPAYA